MELLVHRRNTTARRLYEGLIRFAVCSWWRRAGEGWEREGESLYRPERPGSTTP